jgi:hypothetical protein
MRRIEIFKAILFGMETINQEFFDFYKEEVRAPISQRRRLVLVPTTHGESFDTGFAPKPTSPEFLPEPTKFTLAYLVSVIEVILGKRQLRQIARNTHRFVFDSIASQIGKFPELPKIQRIYRSYPIEGVIEVVATLKFNRRIRALAMRFEGVDGRWLCTELDLL